MKELNDFEKGWLSAKGLVEYWASRSETVAGK